MNEDHSATRTTSLEGQQSIPGFYVQGKKVPPSSSKDHSTQSGFGEQASLPPAALANLVSQLSQLSSFDMSLIEFYFSLTPTQKGKLIDFFNISLAGESRQETSPRP